MMMINFTIWPGWQGAEYPDRIPTVLEEEKNEDSEHRAMRVWIASLEGGQAKCILYEWR